MVGRIDRPGKASIDDCGRQCATRAMIFGNWASGASGRGAGRRKRDRLESESRVLCSAHLRNKAPARSCVTGMPLRRGTRFPRGWGEWGGPWLPAHYPVLVLKQDSTA